MSPSFKNLEECSKGNKALIHERVDKICLEMAKNNIEKGLEILILKDEMKQYS